MTALRLAAAAFALAAISPAGAQVLPGGGLAGPLYGQPGTGSLYPTPIPPQTGLRGGGGRRHGGGFGFGGGFYLYDEPYVVHEVTVVHDVPAAAPEEAPPPPAPREPYVIGRTYASLPEGCMKMVEGGAAYFKCGDGWYLQVGSGYKAVEMPL